MEGQTLDFSEALIQAKHGRKISRIAFKDTCYIVVKQPDTENTLPYLQMVKGNYLFPVDLSCESIFADDWYIL